MAGHSRGTIARGERSTGVSPVRLAGLAYGIVAFVLAIAFWPLFILFISNLPRIQAPLLPKTVSVAPTILPFWQAFAVDLGLILAFAIQHSILARVASKAVWHPLIPEPFRRATFVHLANIFAFSIVWHWQPIPVVIWQLDHDSIIRFLIMPFYAIGWVMLLVGARSYDLTALFGLRHIWFWYRGEPYQPVDISGSPTYWHARHPEFLGVFLGIWVTADMTVGHLLMASALTIYSFIGLHFTERALLARRGQAYLDYMRKVPMLGPPWATWGFVGGLAMLYAISIAQTWSQRAEDARIRGDLATLHGAIVAYRNKTGQYPRTYDKAACEHPFHARYYDELMTTLISGGHLQKRLAHPNRRKGDLGYCYWRVAGQRGDVLFLWTKLDSASLSHNGMPGSCRPFGPKDWVKACNTDRASRDYCLCLP